MLNKKSKTESMLLVNIYTAIVLILLSPPLYSISILRIVMVALMMVWLAIGIVKNNFKVPWITVFVVLYIAFSIVKYNIDTNLLINPRITRIYYYCFFVAGFPFVLKDGIRKYKRVVWRLLAVLPVWLIISAYYGFTVDELFRSMSGSGILDAEYYARLGVVGYDYIYGIVICIPVFLGLLFSKKKLKTAQFVLVIINLALNSLILWIANYGLAFFSMLMGIILFFVLGISNKSWRILFAIITVAVTIVLLLNLQAVVRGMMSMLSGTFYYGKLQDLYQSLSEGTSYGRIDIWKNAFEEFFANPIWGKGFYVEGGVNTHSEILYALVYYGVFAGGAELAVLFSAFYRCDWRSAMSYRVNIATILVFIIVIMFDPAGIAFGPLMFALFKLSQYYFIDEPSGKAQKEAVAK